MLQTLVSWCKIESQIQAYKSGRNYIRGDYKFNDVATTNLMTHASCSTYHRKTQHIWLTASNYKGCRLLPIFKPIKLCRSTPTDSKFTNQCCQLDYNRPDSQAHHPSQKALRKQSSQRLLRLWFSILSVDVNFAGATQHHIYEFHVQGTQTLTNHQISLLSCRTSV